jgi:hypothetical protein
VIARGCAERYLAQRASLGWPLLHGETHAAGA